MLFPQLTIESRPGLLCFILGITSVSKYLAFSPCNNLKKKSFYNTIRQSFRHTGGGIVNIPLNWDIKCCNNFYFLILLLINSLLTLYICQKLPVEYEFVAI